MFPLLGKDIHETGCLGTELGNNHKTRTASSPPRSSSTTSSSVNKNNSNTIFCSEFLAFLKPFSVNCDWIMLSVTNTYVIKYNPVHYVSLSLSVSHLLRHKHSADTPPPHPPAPVKPTTSFTDSQAENSPRKTNHVIYWHTSTLLRTPPVKPATAHVTRVVQHVMLFQHKHRPRGKAPFLGGTHIEMRNRSGRELAWLIRPDVTGRSDGAGGWGTCPRGAWSLWGKANGQSWSRHVPDHLSGVNSAVLWVDWH